MFATLEAKAIAVLAALLLGGGLFGWYTFHERHKGEAIELTALKKSSDKLLAAANQRIADLNTHHVAEVAAITETFNAQHKADLAQSASDADRLREYDAYRRQHAAMGSASGGPSAQATGDGGPFRDDAIFNSLEQVALGLATAGAESKTALTACMIDRDKLTGK